MQQSSLQKHLTFLLFFALLRCVIADGPLRPPLTATDDPSGDAAPATPVMEVRGNDYIIPDGDTSPRDEDDTDFGYEYVDERTRNHYFTIYNIGNADLVLNGPVYISLGGDDPGDFEVRVTPADTTLSPGEHTSFAIAFEPIRYGERRATVYIYSNDSNSPYTFRIQGGDDDEYFHWYGSCGMASSQSSLDLLLAVAALVLFMAMGRRFKARTEAQ